MLALEYRRQLLKLPMTPLIDVVFILLLFFMLSSTFARNQQITFDTSAAGGKNNSDAPATSVSLIVSPDGSVLLNGATYKTAQQQFQALLSEWVQLDKTVVVTARSQTSVQTLILTLDSLRNAGLTNLSLSESL